MGNSQTKPVVFTGQVSLNHFRLLRVVGKGAFGKVRIVERKDTGLTFALKYIRKDEIVRSECVRNIIRERRMLEHLRHPFICNLRYSFQDVEYLYIVVDLMNGGDLRFHISRKTFTEPAVRFWIAELGCALRYIHKQGIVHRDVKPDNILLDSEGHLHLADFNVASDFTPRKLLTSKSGTLAYLAPEVFEGRGYLSEVDWWSLGVVFYECIYNKRPFEKGSTDLPRQIIKAEPKYPATNPPVTLPCLHAIKSFLEKDRRKRIGAAGWDTFITNPFFHDIDFDLLEQKRVPPIFVPSSEKTNFDATYDLEELLLEEAPLEARARRQRPREQLKSDATDKEIREDELHRMIETLFEPFDYTAIPEPESILESNKIIPPVEDTTVSSMSGEGPSDTPHVSAPSSHTSRSASPAKDAPAAFPPLVAANSPADILISTKYTDTKPSSPPSFSRPLKKSSTPNNPLASSGQSVPDESGAWADLANRDPAAAGDGKAKEGNNRHTGMLSFLSRKKGRGSSPKPQERGVLGKEGARVVIC
ncbi:MAG: hypothetical protein M1829_000597 [Trizodia sp. TS-e1964]|nr:MAG: hypothetical protein M1829_000597 [Trizodia sp. TS-e1964]